MKGLKVAARTSCFAFKGQTPDLKLVGEKLGVAHVLEGSVRKAGSRLRITAQLIKAADGYHLWSNTFNRELDDVFQIQEDIARAVADALKVTLGMGETATPGGTTNIEAYDLYLRAQALAGQFLPAELIRAEQLSRQALALDPDFALGWVRLANVLFFLALYVPERSAEFHKAMDVAIVRALSLAPDLWESHWARGLQALSRYDWREAEAALGRALALAPANEPEPSYWMSVVHIHAGRAGSAAPYIEEARRIDPLSVNLSYQLQQDLTIAGRWDEAEAEYARSKDLAGDREPSEHTAMWRACALGDEEAFKARIQRFLDAETIPLPALREVSALMDQPDAARAKLREANEDPANQDATRQFKLAMWAGHFGDVDLSLSAIRRAFVEGKALPLNTIWLPMMAPVRKDPRFKDFLRDLGLVHYWRASGDWGDFARPLGDDDFEVIA
jgi:tetratricopeptide (TPR) repeat protein